MCDNGPNRRECCGGLTRPRSRIHDRQFDCARRRRKPRRQPNRSGRHAGPVGSRRAAAAADGRVAAVDRADRPRRGAGRHQHRHRGVAVRPGRVGPVRGLSLLARSDQHRLAGFRQPDDDALRHLLRRADHRRHPAHAAGAVVLDGDVRRLGPGRHLALQRLERRRAAGRGHPRPSAEHANPTRWSKGSASRSFCWRSCR